MVIHWLGRGGEQKSIGTISNQDKTKIFRVFLTWIENQGWKPTKVEELKEIEIKK